MRKAIQSESEPKRAIIIDDNERALHQHEEFLVNSGWLIEAVAKDTTTALQLLEELHLNSTQLAAILIDGVLEDIDWYTPFEEVYAEQGGAIAKRAKELFPNVPTIGISVVDTVQQKDKNVDYTTGKILRTLKRVLQQIEKNQ